MKPNTETSSTATPAPPLAAGADVARYVQQHRRELRNAVLFTLSARRLIPQGSPIHEPAAALLGMGILSGSDQGEALLVKLRPELASTAARLAGRGRGLKPW